MGKERLSAFTDALLAIIMTILVLELKEPAEMSLAGFWDSRETFFSYMVSFFWLGAMWVNMHMEWHTVKKINNKVIWYTLIMLFFSSLFPYVTRIVNTHFYNTAAQALYGALVFCVTFSNAAMYKSLVKADPFNRELVHRMKNRGAWARLDIALKGVGFVLSFLYPPAMLLAVLATLVFIVIPNQIKNDYKQ